MEYSKDNNNKFSQFKQFKNSLTKSKISNIAIDHINSFNQLINKGLDEIALNLPETIIKKTTENFLYDKISLKLDNFEVSYPQKISSSFMSGSQDTRLYPWECRMMSISYTASLSAELIIKMDKVEDYRIRIKLCTLPIMVGSNRCNLTGTSSNSISNIINREDLNEHGGYFIINGNSRLIRMTINPRRNQPQVFSRRGGHFVAMKCVRADECSQTVRLNLLPDGSVTARVVINKRERLFPIIIIAKALLELADFDFFQLLCKGYNDIKSFVDKAEIMLVQGFDQNVSSQSDAIVLIGQIGRTAANLDSHLTDQDAGLLIINRQLQINVHSWQEKFQIMINCLQRLFLVTEDIIKPDNADSLNNQEVQISGCLYMNYLRECLEEVLIASKARILKEMKEAKANDKLANPLYVRDIVEKQSKQVGTKIEYLISTGNIKSRTGLDLLQQTGQSIVADKLNPQRFISHFRAVHRGSQFTEMKTTEVRKLLPEQFGFICPVHTPDGAPCGLLNHISKSCNVVTEPSFDQELSYKSLITILTKLGMVSGQEAIKDSDNVQVNVHLDGRILGQVELSLAPGLAIMLRKIKCRAISQGEINIQQKYLNVIPENLEVIQMPKKSTKSQFFGGILLFSQPGRLVRKINYVEFEKEVTIGPIEQMFLNISLKNSNCAQEFKEIDENNFLSILANLTPLSNHNQSPRNMYQCQMLKQSMTHMNHNYQFRFDNKAYRLYFPQIPLVRTHDHEDYGCDEYPSGTNAVVAVLSYTGYDMEDAMIINKSSYERGFSFGCVQKTVDYNQNGKDQKVKNNYSHFNKSVPIQRTQSKLLKGVQADGIVGIGHKLDQRDPVFCVQSEKEQKLESAKWKENETAQVEQVLVYPGGSANEFNQKVKQRIPRNPIIGDKFSSRHGQKGVLGYLWPNVDMPFSENGISPDIIINPHAFPSRMTIGMLIESIAGKQGALNGDFSLGSTFQSNQSEDNYNVVDQFGNRLKDKGYYQQGNETLYSGIQGNLMKADIFMGLVYQQRLRHMISDKAQARATGTVDPMTQQPLKGRKKGGGIRVGEMERDSLISHGVAHCIQDRLLYSSDVSDAIVCEACGTLLGAYNLNVDGKDIPQCAHCANNKNCRKIQIPWTLRLLMVELLAMNISINIGLRKNWS